MRLRQLAVVTVLLSTSGAARADLERAVEAFNAGDFRHSLTLLKQAAPGVHEPRALGRLQLYTGLNHAFLGQTAKARRSFRSALGHDPTLEVDPVRIRPDVVQIFHSVRSKLRGELVVSSRMPATVVVDGVEQGSAPLRLRLSVGRHGLEVLDRQGVPRYRGWVVIHHGKPTPVDVRAPPSGSGAGALFEVRAGRAGQRAGPRFRRGALRDETPAPSRSRLWTWVAAGGSVVAGAVGLGLVLAGASDHEEYMTTVDCGRFAALEESIPRKYTAGYVMLGLAGAAAVATAVLYLLERRPATSTTAREPPGLTGFGLQF